MKLNKYITLISTLVFCAMGTLCHAEQINFNGTISEFTCAQQSTEQACLDLKKAIKQLKSQQSDITYTTLNKQTSKIAAISIESTESQHHKVMVINYH